MFFLTQPPTTHARVLFQAVLDDNTAGLVDHVSLSVSLSKNIPSVSSSHQRPNGTFWIYQLSAGNTLWDFCSSAEHVPTRPASAYSFPHHPPVNSSAVCQFAKSIEHRRWIRGRTVSLYARMQRSKNQELGRWGARQNPVAREVLSTDVRVQYSEFELHVLDIRAWLSFVG